MSMTFNLIYGEASPNILYLVQNGELANNISVTTIFKAPTSSAFNEISIAPNAEASGSYYQISYSKQSASTGGIGYFTKKISLRKYSTIHIQGQVYHEVQAASNENYAGIGVWTDIGSYQTSNRIIAQKTPNAANYNWANIDLTIDISSQTDKAYIGWYGVANSLGWTGIKISNLWLD